MNKHDRKKITMPLPSSRIRNLRFVGNAETVKYIALFYRSKEKASQQFRYPKNVIFFSALGWSKDKVSDVLK